MSAMTSRDSTHKDVPARSIFFLKSICHPSDSVVDSWCRGSGLKAKSVALLWLPRCLAHAYRHCPHGRMERGGHGFCKVSLGPTMPNPCFRGGLPTRRAPCGHHLPFWTPHAVRLCIGLTLGLAHIHDLGQNRAQTLVSCFRVKVELRSSSIHSKLEPLPVWYHPCVGNHRASLFQPSSRERGRGRLTV
jgi:hypothetical protein